MQDNLNADQERLRCLRERQLAERDPHVKQRRVQQQITRRERQLTKRVTLTGIWSDIPHVWKGAIYGLVSGVCVLAILPELWDSTWSLPCAVVGALVFILLGIMIGRTLDLRDEIKHLAQ